MSLPIPKLGETLPSILEIPMPNPASSGGKNKATHSLRRLADIPVPDDAYSRMLLKFEKTRHRITKESAGNLGSIVESNTAAVKSDVVANHIDTPSPRVAPKVTVLGVENARKRLKAFCIQKKQSSLLAAASSSPTSVKPPAPVSSSSGSVLIGKMLHGSLKKIAAIHPEVDHRKDKTSKNKSPLVVKKTQKKESEYERRRNSLNAMMKMQNMEIRSVQQTLPAQPVQQVRPAQQARPVQQVRLTQQTPPVLQIWPVQQAQMVQQALSKLGVPLSLLPPVEAYQAKPAPLKIMPFHYQRFLYPSEIELLVQKASLLKDDAPPNITVPYDKETRDLINSLKLDYTEKRVVSRFSDSKMGSSRNKKDRIGRTRHESHSSSGVNDHNDEDIDISMEDLVVCDSWSLENDSNQMDENTAEETSEEPAKITNNLKRKGDEGKMKKSEVIDMFSLDTEKQERKKDDSVKPDSRGCNETRVSLNQGGKRVEMLSVPYTNDFSSEIYSPAASTSSLEDAIAFAANIGDPCKSKDIRIPQKAKDDNFDSNSRDILHLESYYSPDMASSGDTTPIMRPGTTIDSSDVQVLEQKSNNKANSKSDSRQSYLADGEDVEYDGRGGDRKESSRDDSKSKDVIVRKDKIRETEKSKDKEFDEDKGEKGRGKTRDRRRSRWEHPSDKSRSPTERKKSDSSKERHKEHKKESRKEYSKSPQLDKDKVQIKEKVAAEKESRTRNHQDDNLNIGDKIQDGHKNSNKKGSDRDSSQSSQISQHVKRDTNGDSDRKKNDNLREFVEENTNDAKFESNKGRKENDLRKSPEKLVKDKKHEKERKSRKSRRKNSPSPEARDLAEEPEVDAPLGSSQSPETRGPGDKDDGDKSEPKKVRGSVWGRLPSKSVDEVWKSVEEMCAPKVHTDTKCHRLTKHTPAIKYCENLNNCECLVGVEKDSDSLAAKVSAITREESIDERDESQKSTSRDWYPSVDYVLADKSAIELSTNWETDDSTSQNDSNVKRQKPSSLTTHNLAKFDTANNHAEQSLKTLESGIVRNNLKSDLIDVTAILPPKEKTERTVAAPSLDLEYEKFMETVWPEIAGKQEEDSRCDNRGKVEGTSQDASMDCDSIKNYFDHANDSIDSSSCVDNKMKSFSNVSSVEDAAKDISLDLRDLKKSKKAKVVTAEELNEELKLVRSDSASRGDVIKMNKREKKLDSGNWSGESETEVKKIVKTKKSNSLSVKAEMNKRKGHAKVSSRRNKRKKDISHKRQGHRSSTASDSSSTSSSSSSSSSSDSSTGDSSTDSSDSDRKKKKKRSHSKKKKNKTSTSKSKKNRKKRISKAKELAKKLKLKKKKRKLREQAKLKSKEKSAGAEKKRDDPYSSDEEDLKAEMIAEKAKKLKKSNSKRSKSVTSKRKAQQETDRDKRKKRRKRDVSSSSSSSESESDRRTKSKKRRKRKSSSPDVAEKQHSRKKRRRKERQMEVEEDDAEDSDQFNMETVLNIKREKTSEDEADKLSISNGQFSPRINRVVHTQEIISVNELHSDFVESSKNIVETVIPDAVVKTEPHSEEVAEDNVMNVEATAATGEEISERFSGESEHSNSTQASFASLRNSLSFSQNSMDSTHSAVSSEKNSLNSISQCENSTSSLKNLTQTSPVIVPSLPDNSDNSVVKKVGHFESISSSMQTESSRQLDVVDQVIENEIELPDDGSKNTAPAVPEAVLDEIKESGSVESTASIQSDMESQRRAVEEFDRLKREFEEFKRQRLKHNMTAERIAAAEELKRQFDMVENYDLPAKVTPPVVENKQISDIRPIPTVTGVMPASDSSAPQVMGEIKWDWRPDSSHGNTGTRVRKQSRWGVIPHSETLLQNNSTLIEVELVSEAEIQRPTVRKISPIRNQTNSHTSRDNDSHVMSDYETPYTADEMECPSDDKVYKIQTISSVTESRDSYTDGLTAEDYETNYEMYSETQEMSYVAGQDESDDEDTKAAKKISLDERINLVLQYPSLSVAVGATNGDSSPSPPPTDIKPSPEKGILVVAGIRVTRLDPRTLRMKKVCFSDGLAPGQDSDLEDTSEISQAKKSCLSLEVKKKRQKRQPCGGHAYPCPSHWPDYRPRWDPLPPPPPPPGSPPPHIYQPRCNMTVATVMNTPDALITRLPKIASHTETLIS